VRLGAEWYIGAGDRYTESSSISYSGPKPANDGAGLPTGLRSSGYLMPFGRPVVPDEYSIAWPSSSSARGSAGYDATASS
jgi:hypothetical protein